MNVHWLSRISRKKKNRYGPLLRTVGLTKPLSQSVRISAHDDAGRAPTLHVLDGIRQGIVGPLKPGHSAL
jgi:hypothetical protein